MAEEILGHEFWFKNIDETWNFFTKGIDQNELMTNKHKCLL